MHAAPAFALVPQALEALMLICFGIAWPMNSLAMLRNRRAEGKGLVFTMIVWCGYLAGAAAKITMALQTGAALPPVFWLYVLNSLTVGFNAWLYRRFTLSFSPSPHPIPHPTPDTCEKSPLR